MTELHPHKIRVRYVTEGPWSTISTSDDDFDAKKIASRVARDFQDEPWGSRELLAVQVDGDWFDVKELGND